jgi:hypothetical protein
MKTSELTGAALDWAVAKCEEMLHLDNAETWLRDYRIGFSTRYSTVWSQGGPIIEREGIGLDQYADYPKWQAFTPAPEQPSGHCVCNGPTPLLAAMRCYVASKLGDEVDVPEELCQPSA